MLGIICYSLGALVACIAVCVIVYGGRIIRREIMGMRWVYQRIDSRRYTRNARACADKYVRSLPPGYCACGYKDECPIWCGPGHMNGRCP